MNTTARHLKVKKLEERDGPLCWICKLPMSFRFVSGGLDITVSIDHQASKKCQVIDGLKLAHRWCNSKRQREDVTDAMVALCRARIEPILEKYSTQRKFLKIKDKGRNAQ